MKLEARVDEAHGMGGDNDPIESLELVKDAVLGELLVTVYHSVQVGLKRFKRQVFLVCIAQVGVVHVWEKKWYLGCIQFLKIFLFFVKEEKNDIP